MTFLTAEPVESVRADIARDVCENDDCPRDDELVYVSVSDQEDSGVYCPGCAHAILFGGGA